MICEKCGVVYEGNFCPNGCNSPATPKKAKKPIYKKWWFWVIIAVVAIAIIGGGSDAPENGETQPPTVTAPNNETQAPTVSTPSTEAQPTETTAPAADNVYHAGDIINANGLKITYVKGEKWEEYESFFAPKDGYIYVRLYLSVENNSNSDKYISSFEFTCYADGKKEESTYLGDDLLEGGTLSSGRKDEGYIYFIVPLDAKEIEVEYETSFWTDKKAILKVELP